MKRKEFLKNTGILIGGSLTIPSIFAGSKPYKQTSDYVILINLGGGIRKQDVFGGSKSKNQYRSADLETIMPLFFGGRFPDRILKAINPSPQHEKFTTLISQGVLFAEVETDSNDHESSFRSLITLKDAPNDNLNGHSVYSMLSKYKRLPQNQMWQIGGVKIDNEKNHTYLAAGKTDKETLDKAAEIITKYNPKFININLNDADVCHSSYSSYLNSVVRSTESIKQLWDEIQQSESKMAGKTTLILIPELGRNSKPNSIVDQFGFHSYDHNDENSRKIWSLIVGAGISESNRNNIITDLKKSHQILPTIAQLFGVFEEIQRQHFMNNQFQGLL